MEPATQSNQGLLSQAVSMLDNNTPTDNTLNPNPSKGFIQKAVDALQGNGQDTTSNDPWSNFQNAAQQVVTQRGLPKTILPVLLGQAAIESARGQAAPGNNYFGVKGQGTAGSNNLATQEYGNGGYYGENSNFAAYNSPEDSINSYLDLVLSYPGVPQAIQSGDPAQVIQAIKANGYATSPTYIQSVMNTPEYQSYAGGGSQ